MESNDVHPKKQLTPNVFTVEGMTNSVNAEQFLNEDWSINVIADGRVTVVKELQPLKVPFPDEVKELGITALFNPVQPEKSEPPMLVTVEGNKMFVNPVHPINALLFMVETDDGITMEVRLAQL